MKKYLSWSIFISIVLFFLSSFAFPKLGERLVVPVMMICTIVGGISAVYVLLYPKYRKNLKRSFGSVFLN